MQKNRKLESHTHKGENVKLAKKKTLKISTHIHSHTQIHSNTQYIQSFNT